MDAEDIRIQLALDSDTPSFVTLVHVRHLKGCEPLSLDNTSLESKLAPRPSSLLYVLPFTDGERSSFTGRQRKIVPNRLRPC